jgi:hypothetical protein
MKTMENIIYNSHPTNRELNSGLPESDEGMVAAQRHSREEVTGISVMSRGLIFDPAI